MDPLLAKLLDFGATGVMLAVALVALRQVSERLFNYMRDRITVYEASFLVKMAEHEKSAAERNEQLMKGLSELMKGLSELVERARKMNGK